MRNRGRLGNRCWRHHGDLRREEVELGRGCGRGFLSPSSLLAAPPSEGVEGGVPQRPEKYERVESAFGKEMVTQLDVSRLAFGESKSQLSLAGLL